MASHNRIRKLMILLFWITVWHIAALLIHNNIVFVGPLDVIHSLSQLIITAGFWISIAYSFFRILLGFCGAFFCGILAGSLAYRFSLLKEFLDPLVLMIKSVPIASFIILALIWIGSENLSILISFLVVFPVLYVNTIAGLESTDKDLLEMAAVFSIRTGGRIRCIYLPSLSPYLVSGCQVALGMSWKSGIAAEVIGVPAHSIGENLYLSKIYLGTADLFAWTIVIIVISSLFEKLFLMLLKKGAGL